MAAFMTCGQQAIQRKKAIETIWGFLKKWMSELDLRAWTPGWEPLQEGDTWNCSIVDTHVPIPLCWRRSISLVRQSMSICSSLFLHRNCFISSICKRRHEEMSWLAIGTMWVVLVSCWLISANNTEPRSYWAQQQWQMNLPQPLSFFVDSNCTS